MKREKLLQIAKPILFNTDMALAILNDLKTETRRIAKTKKGFTYRSVGESRNEENPLGLMYPCGILRPRYSVGDILYIRETWAEWTGGYLYRAWPGPFHQPGQMHGMRWYPSIHMPKEAARIFLRVTDVRVERLQDITIDGIRSEGLTSMSVHTGDEEIAYKEWQILWDSTINKKEMDMYGWEANPWVWVYEFEKVEVE